MSWQDRTPAIKLTIDKSLFNKLISILDFNIKLELEDENFSDIAKKLKEKLMEIKDTVLNIRVGGNDFSNMYGLRRNINQNIYEIGVIRDILVNIINVFGSEFVVSGPVWEYFGSDVDEEWKHGLVRELELDKLNGFIGKTAIHPSQIPVIYENLKVIKSDYEDAIKILGWDLDEYGVDKSSNGSRMNEVKCHLRWADRIYKLGQVYGIKD